MSKPFIKKDDQRIPDFYGITVEFITGQTKEFKIVNHVYMNELRAIELLTFDNEYVVLPLDNVVISFDKAFTKLIELRKEKENQKPNNQPNAYKGDKIGSKQTKI